MVGENQEKRELAEWFNLHRERMGISYGKLSRASGVGVATLHRMAGKSTETASFPKIQHIKAVARIFGVAPPPIFQDGADYGPGFQEDGAVQVQPGKGEESNGGFDPNISEWEVRDDAMRLMGYLPGDKLRVDGRLQPRDGDAVIAQLYSADHKSAQTALRLFRAPGYVLSANPDPRQADAREIGKNAIIMGVVVHSWRDRLAS